MALSEFEIRRIEKLFNGFCDKRVPERLRQQIRVEFRIRDADVELFESRPLYNDPSSWVSTRIACFRKSVSNGNWMLYLADRNARWKSYEPCVPQRDIEALLQVVEDDAMGAFWG